MIHVRRYVFDHDPKDQLQIDTLLDTMRTKLCIDITRGFYASECVPGALKPFIRSVAEDARRDLAMQLAQFIKVAEPYADHASGTVTLTATFHAPYVRDAEFKALSASLTSAENERDGMRRQVTILKHQLKCERLPFYTKLWRKLRCES